MGHVLIIDNDQILRSVLADELTKAGIASKQAEDGLQGLESAKQEHPTVIILDEHMPNMNGQQFIEALQKEPWFAEVHIVVFTSLHDTDLMNHKMIAGINDYLDKSTTNPDDVIKIVQKYIQPAA